MSGTTLETINQLPVVATPATTDVYAVQQADGVTRQATAAQITLFEQQRAEAAESSISATASEALATANNAQPKINAAASSLMLAPATYGAQPGALPPSTAGQLPIATGTSWAPQTVSGDGTLSSAGALTVTKSNGTAFGGAAFLAAGGANGAAVLDASGYLSANSAIASGATTALTLADRAALFLLPEDFGAGKTCTGSIASGSTSLTVSDATLFANGDNVRVIGAGTDYQNTDLVASVVSGGGTTTLTLSKAATATVTSAVVHADDTSALLAWIAATKASAEPKGTVSYFFPPNSKYLISDSLTFGYADPTNGGNRQTFTINGNGTVILGTTSGPAMLDCINFAYGSKISSLLIQGISGGSQQCALLYGYSTATTGVGWSDGFILDAVDTYGYFNFGCVINRGSDSALEQNCHNQSLILTGVGIDIGEAGHCWIGDSEGQWAVTSDIATISPFTISNPIGPRRTGCVDQTSLGSPFWLDSNVSLTQTGGYTNTTGGTEYPIVIVYILESLQGGSPRMDFDVHAETIGSMSHVFYYYAPWATSSNTAQLIYLFHTHVDPGVEASISVHGAGPNVTFIRFDNVDWDIFSQISAPLFDTPSYYYVAGTIRGLAAASWVAPGAFYGIFYGEGVYSGYTWGNGSALYFDSNGTYAPQVVGSSTFGLTNVSINTVEGNLSVSGDLSVNGDLSANGNLSVVNSFDITGVSAGEIFQTTTDFTVFNGAGTLASLTIVFQAPTQHQETRFAFPPGLAVTSLNFVPYAPAWQANYNYSVLDTIILDSNGNLQQVTTTGTSAASAPTWNTTVGGTTTDGTVTWTRLANPTIGAPTEIPLAAAGSNMGNYVVKFIAQNLGSATSPAVWWRS